MFIYDFNDYKAYLKAWLKEHPKGGRGQLRKMAEHIRVSTTLLSQTINSDKHLSLETAAEISEYIGHSEKESEYFLLLIETQRAGSFKLKKILEKKLSNEQQNASQLKNRLPSDHQLTDEEKMQFYSSWIFSAIRILSALPEIKNAKDISTRLNIPLSLTNDSLNFLIEKGLCLYKDGKITYGPLRTHVGKDSPFVVKHHQNWRIQGFHKMELRKNEDLFFTQPMAMSKEAALKIRTLLPGIIENILSISGPSDSEVVRCLNIDWFEY